MTKICFTTSMLRMMVTKTPSSSLGLKVIVS